MKHRGKIFFPFLAFTILFLAAKAVAACECPDTDDTVLGKFEDARFVVIVKVIVVEKSSQGEVTQSKMVIEKVYKGNLRVGEEMIFGQGESGSCREDFDERDIGVKFLFYLKPKKKSVWYAESCGQAKALPGFEAKFVEDAADDLSYLEKMDKVAGKSRISGTLISYQWSTTNGGAGFKKVRDTKVRLIGEKQTYETETNEDGVYEIYDLPPGRYKVEPKTPKGWVIENPSVFGGGGSSGREGEHFLLTLKKGRHAYFDFFFIPDTKVRGRVFDPSGNPMKMVCVNLIPTAGKVSEHFRASDCTAADGVFEINEVPFGNFFMVVNEDDKISAYEPFRRFYYPNVYEREKAKVFKIVESDNVKAIDIHVPEAKEVVDIKGVFRSADGNPVTRGRIVFRPEKTDELTDGYGFAITDAAGRFSLRVLKGLKGTLVGAVTLDGKEFRDCRQIVARLKTKKEFGWEDQQTDRIEIQTEGNIDNIELRLPFASCKGGKIVSRMKID